MIKKTCLTMFIASAVFSSPLFAVEHTVLTHGITIEYNLKPNDPLELTAYLKVDASCTVHTPDVSDELFVEALKKGGEIDGQSISAPETRTIVVNDGKTFRLYAERAAKVRLTNLGASTIKATCRT